MELAIFALGAMLGTLTGVSLSQWTQGNKGSVMNLITSGGALITAAIMVTMIMRH